MKKNVLLFATASVLMATTVTFTECTPKEEAPKNYYGVQNDNTGVSKDAYITFSCVLFGAAVLIAWAIKKAKQSNKK